MNRAELRAEIARKGISNKAIIEALNISEQAFYNKIKGTTEFKESEIRALVDVLGLTAEDINRIFLAA